MRLRRLALVCGIAAALTPQLSARTAPMVDATAAMTKFLGQPALSHPYRAERRLEAAGSGQRGWLDARTDFTPTGGLTYVVTDEGGSGYIRSRVLRTLLEEERQLIARGGSSGVALSPANYDFTPQDVDEAGLARVAMKPLRKERPLIIGTMFLNPDDGDLVRVEGRLAKNPSLWVSRVAMVRTYRRINGVLFPVSLESTAQLRLLGRSTLRMTYTYTDVDGQPVGPATEPVTLTQPTTP